MNISSSHGRRVAHSAQDFQHIRPKAGVAQEFKTLAAKPALGSDKLGILASRGSELSLRRQAASEAVRQMTGEAPPPIKASIASGWNSARVLTGGNDKPASSPKNSSTSTRREWQIMQVFKRLENHFGTSIPRAEFFLESRRSMPTVYQLFESFAQAADLGESVEFINAVSEFRSQPSASSAREIVKKFIEPSPVDEFGIPIEDKSKKQINMSSDHARKQLISSVESQISELSQGDDAAVLKKLASVFDSTEANIQSMLIKNFNSRVTELTQTKARTEVTPAPTQSAALRFA